VVVVAAVPALPAEADDVVLPSDDVAESARSVTWLACSRRWANVSRWARF
jgi:hypothetical protein